jgi:hypothetical protein
MSRVADTSFDVEKLSGDLEGRRVVTVHPHFLCSEVKLPSKRKSDCIDVRPNITIMMEHLTQQRPEESWHY